MYVCLCGCVRARACVRACIYTWIFFFSYSNNVEDYDGNDTNHDDDNNNYYYYCYKNKSGATTTIDHENDVDRSLDDNENSMNMKKYESKKNTSTQKKK